MFCFNQMSCAEVVSLASCFSDGIGVLFYQHVMGQRLPYIRHLTRKGFLPHHVFRKRPGLLSLVSQHRCLNLSPLPWEALDFQILGPHVHAISVVRYLTTLPQFWTSWILSIDMLH